MLPVGFDASGATRYPMLLLLHGGAGRYTDWANAGLLELTKDLPLITVLPDAGRSAWYTDWYNNGAGGPPMWETYHLGQLLPWVDANFPTVGARSGRAIAGLSSGGFGALSYASRHPDLFVAAAGFSAALDTNTPPVVAGKFIDALAAHFTLYTIDLIGFGRSRGRQRFVLSESSALLARWMETIGLERAHLGEKQTVGTQLNAR